MPLSTKRRTSLPAYLKQQNLSTEQRNNKTWKRSAEEDKGIGDDFWVDECMKLKILRSKRMTNKLGTIKPSNSPTIESIQELDESPGSARQNSLALGSIQPQNPEPRRLSIPRLEALNTHPYDHSHIRSSLWDEEPDDTNDSSNNPNPLTTKSYFHNRHNSRKDNATKAVDRLLEHRGSEPIRLRLPDQPIKLDNHPVLAAIPTNQSNVSITHHSGSVVNTRKKLKLLPDIKPRRSIDVNDPAALKSQSRYLDNF